MYIQKSLWTHIFLELGFRSRFAVYPFLPVFQQVTAADAWGVVVDEKWERPPSTSSFQLKSLSRCNQRLEHHDAVFVDSKTLSLLFALLAIAAVRKEIYDDGEMVGWMGARNFCSLSDRFLARAPP
jgi:hypothetical protein